MTTRFLGRLRALGSLALALANVPPWLFSKPKSAGARRLERAFFETIARGFGIRTIVSGKPSGLPGTLFVMNHISWADIPVVMALLDADFVAKSDISQWPVLGALAKRFDPVFVARNRRGHSHTQADAIRTRLKSGRSVILCAEGTTSDGAGILPFRTTLFAAADAASNVQPIVLRYLDSAGNRLTPERQREVAWIEDDTLLPSVIGFARHSVLASVTFLAPIVPTLECRKSLAAEMRDAMLDCYAAAPNLPR